MFSVLCLFSKSMIYRVEFLVRTILGLSRGSRMVEFGMGIVSECYCHLEPGIRLGIGFTARQRGGGLGLWVSGVCSKTEGLH